MRVYSTLHHVLHHNLSLDLDLAQWSTLLRHLFDSHFKTLYFIFAIFHYKSLTMQSSHKHYRGEWREIYSSHRLTNCAMSSNARVVGDLLNAPQRLKNFLREVAAQIMIAECENTFDGFVDKSLLENHSASRIRPTQFSLSARIENTISRHNATVSTLMKNLIMPLLVNADWSTNYVRRLH